jgi:hypothetical protein
MDPAFLRERLLFFTHLVSGAVSVWFIVWGLRRRFDLDLKLSRAERKIRWMMVGLGAVVALIPGPSFGYFRLLFGVAGVSFFVWPNLGHHAMRLFPHKPDETV